MAKRAMVLLDFLAKTDSTEAKFYLGRLAQCYIRGMVPEGLIMCPAVLESAAKTSLAKVGAKTDKCLEKLLEEMKDKSIVPDDDPDENGITTYKSADLIREAGNKAVHKGEEELDLGDAIYHLISVLDHLAGGCQAA